MSIVWVVGTGRCGTKSLAHLFSLLPGVESVHEPKPALARVAAMRMRGEEYDVARTLAHARDEVDKHEHYLESALWNTWLMTDILAKWPQAKFIHLKRDPYKFAHSAYRRGWYHPHSEGNAGVWGLLHPVPTEGWPPGVNRWFMLGYLYGRYNTHIKRMFQGFARWVVVDVNQLNDLEAVNHLVKCCSFPGEIAALPPRENVGGERITWEEIQLRGLQNDLLKTGFQVTHSTHPYAWMTVRRLKEELGLDIGYEDVYPITRDVRDAVDAGVKFGSE